MGRLLAAIGFLAPTPNHVQIIFRIRDVSVLVEIGRKRHITENSNMWAVLRTDTFTPLLEFDFLGSDAWEAMGRSQNDVGDMSCGDKLELRKRQVEIGTASSFSLSHLYLFSYKEIQVQTCRFNY